MPVSACFAAFKICIEFRCTCVHFKLNDAVFIPNVKYGYLLITHSLIQAAFTFAGKADETSTLNVTAKPTPMPATQTKTKDDAYDEFMKEMAGLI